MQLQHFDYSEFDCPAVSGSGKKYMDREFLSMLDYSRGVCKLKFKILKGYLSAGYASSKNESTVSSHRIGRAAVIDCSHSGKRYKIVASLLEAGFVRIGINSKYIYVDNDDQKPHMITIFS
jgi:hypothetical protein